MVGAHKTQRTPTMYFPGRVFFSAGLLLCLTFGIILAGLHDSFIAGDWGWFTFFVISEAACTSLYFANVHSWLRWVNQMGDYSVDYTPVESACEYDTEHHHYPGEY